MTFYSNAGTAETYSLDTILDVYPHYTKTKLERAKLHLQQAIDNYRKFKPRNYKAVWTMPVQFSPEMAAILISLGNPAERPLNRAYTNKLIGLMQANEFTAAFDPIVIDTRGRRANGQHRLHAIEESGMSIWLPFAVDISDAVIKNMDTGRPRSLADRMAQNGDIDKTTSRRLVAIGYAMFSGGINKGRPTELDMWPFLVKHQKLILNLDQFFKHHKRGTGRAGTVGTFARIAYNLPAVLLRLRRAAEILDTGAPETWQPGDKTLIKLRDMLMGPNMPKTGAASNVRVYRLVSRALKAYLDEQTLQKIHEASENYFPLHEDAGVTLFSAD
jgi:hypothetical protein